MYRIDFCTCLPGHMNGNESNDVQWVIHHSIQDDIASTEKSGIKLMGEDYFTMSPVQATVTMWMDEWVMANIFNLTDNVFAGKDIFSRYIARIYKDNVLVMNGVITKPDVIPDHKSNTISMTCYDSMVFLETFQDAEIEVCDWDFGDENFVPNRLRTPNTIEQILRKVHLVIHNRFRFGELFAPALNLAFEHVHAQSMTNLEILDWSSLESQFIEAMNNWSALYTADLGNYMVNNNCDHSLSYQMEVGLTVVDDMVKMIMRTFATLHYTRAYGVTGQLVNYDWYTNTETFTLVTDIVNLIQPLSHAIEHEMGIPDSPYATPMLYHGDNIYELDFIHKKLKFTGNLFLNTLALTAGKTSLGEILKTALLADDLTLWADVNGDYHVRNKRRAGITGDEIWIDADNIITDQPKLVQIEQLTPDSLSLLNASENVKQLIIDYYTENPIMQENEIKVFDHYDLNIDQRIVHKGFVYKVIEASMDKDDNQTIRCMLLNEEAPKSSAKNYTLMMLNEIDNLLYDYDTAMIF